MTRSGLSAYVSRVRTLHQWHTGLYARVLLVCATVLFVCTPCHYLHSNARADITTRMHAVCTSYVHRMHTCAHCGKVEPYKLALSCRISNTSFAVQPSCSSTKCGLALSPNPSIARRSLSSSVCDSLATGSSNAFLITAARAAILLYIRSHPVPCKPNPRSTSPTDAFADAFSCCIMTPASQNAKAA